MPSQHTSMLKVRSLVSRVSSHPNGGINFEGRHLVFKGGTMLPRTVLYVWIALGGCCKTVLFCTLVGFKHIFRFITCKMPDKMLLRPSLSKLRLCSPNHWAQNTGILCHSLSQGPEPRPPGMALDRSSSPSSFGRTRRSAATQHAVGGRIRPPPLPSSPVLW